MAKKTGLSKKTFDRYLPELCDKGYLEDLTPQARNRPHVYRDTGKVRLITRVAVEVDGSGGTESPTSGTESPSRWDTESLEDTMNRPYKERGTETPPPASKSDSQHPAMQAFHRATGKDPPKSWHSDVASVVGDAQEDLDLWYDICHAFVGLGWKPTNVKAMLEYFERAEIPGNNGHAPSHSSGRQADQPETISGLRLDAVPSAIVG
jgi:hypothetical protein